MSKFNSVKIMPSTPVSVAPAEEQSVVSAFFSRNSEGGGLPTMLSHFEVTLPGVPAGYPGPQSLAAPTNVNGVTPNAGGGAANATVPIRNEPITVPILINFSVFIFFLLVFFTCLRPKHN